MIIGVPRETREGEKRVALLPQAVQALVQERHEVRVQADAGEGIGLTDADYERAGATVVNAFDAWSSDLIVKVKEMQDTDFRVAPPGRTIFSFHHLVHEAARTRALAGRGDTAIAFEEVETREGLRPMLAPMSIIAGRMAVDVATKLLGHAPERVLVLGGGHAGMSAARSASRARGRVTVLTRTEKSVEAVREQGFTAAQATPENVAAEAVECDLVVGAVFRGGEPTPKLIPRKLLRRMRKGSVLVDISIEEGGIAETSRATSHARPTYIEHDIIHYCVPNMPAAVPSEGSTAISVAALPFVRQMASQGIGPAVLANPGLRRGVLTWQGRIVHEGIAAEAGLPYTPLTDDDLA
jgi:alanine dehydrogenase